MEVGNRSLFGPYDRSLRILVIDSDVNNLNILCPTLQYFGYAVITCQTAAKALSLLRACPGDFDLLLTDVFFPDSDGFEFLTAVAAENSSLPIVAFSAYLGTDVAIQALQRGASAFYPKPIAAEILQHLWQHAFRKKIQSCSDGDHVAPLLTSPPKLGTPTKTKELKRNNGGNKNRIRWSPELREKFRAAVEVVGAGKLTPKRIMECMERMGVEGINRHQIASHLQQYNKAVKMKSTAEEQVQSDNNNNNSGSETCSGRSIDCVQDYGSVIVRQCSEEPQSSLMPPPLTGVEENFDWTMQFLKFD